MRSLMIAATLLAFPSAAAAETRLLEVPYRYVVVPPMEAGSKRVSNDQIVFDFPLRWDSAAVLSQDVQVTADDRHKDFRKGQALVESRLQFTDSAFAQARSFCAPRTADPTAKGGFLLRNLIGGALARSLTDGQFCIIDRDGDGRAEYSVLVNAGSPAAREPRPIEPVAYELTPGAVVSEGDSMKVRYRGGRNSFELLIIEQGHARVFTSFEYRDREGLTHRYVRMFSGRKLASGVYETGAPGISFKVSGYDPGSNSTLIEWPKTDRTAIVPIPDDVRIHYGYGY